MTSPPATSLNYWRGFLRAAGTDAFEAIEGVIAVAAADSPAELRRRRDSIAEKLYTFTTNPTLPPQALQPPPNVEEGGGSVRRVSSVVAGGTEVGEKESKAGSSLCCSSDRVETVTNEFVEPNEFEDPQDRVVAEVKRIRELLSDEQDKPDGIYLEALLMLQGMKLTVHTLETTEIGKCVSAIRKHSSKQIRHLARSLIESWKAIVDEWVDASAPLEHRTPQSIDPSSLKQEEQSLSPSLEVGSLFTTPNSSIRMPENFNWMDGAGNHKVKTEEYETKKERHEEITRSIEDRGSARRPEPKLWRAKPPESSTGQPKPHNIHSKLANTDSGPGRPQRQNDSKPRSSVDDSPASHRRPQPAPAEKPEEGSVRAKLEAAKLEMARRKLHEGYQQAENAKRQRTIQVMEAQDIPKQNLESGSKQRVQPRSWRS